MTIDPERMISDAKRAARRLARTGTRTYQECLDAIARDAGRAHWGAFLTNPVDVRGMRDDVVQDGLRLRTPSGGKGEGSVVPELLGSDAPMIIHDPKPSLSGAPSGIFRVLAGGGSEGAVLGMEGMRFVRSPRRSTVLCVGEAAVGKTTGVVLPTLALSPTASQIVFDPNAEALRAVASLGIREDSRMLALDPLGEAGHAGVERVAFNPLHPDFADGADPWPHALQIAAALVAVEQGGQAHFQRRGRLALAVVAAHLMLHPGRIPEEAGRRRIASLPAVGDWLLDAGRSGLDAAFQQVVDDCTASGAPQEMIFEAADLAGLPDRERSGVLGAVDKALMIGRSRQARGILDPDASDDGAAMIRALADRERTTTIFLTSSPNGSAAAAPVSALAIDVIARWRAARGPSKRSLQIIVDEGHRLPPVPMIGRMLREGAPHGTMLLVVDRRLNAEEAARTWAAGDRTPRFDHVVCMLRWPTEDDAEAIAALVRQEERYDLERKAIGAPGATHTVIDARTIRRVDTPTIHPTEKRTGK